MTTVLLVDDDPGVRFALTEVLRDRGYRVVAVGSGAAALAVLDGHNGIDVPNGVVGSVGSVASHGHNGIDVVVTDLSMPGMDGLELVSRIAARAPALPVLLLTAHGSDHLVRIASSRGACGCLSKPFDIDEIARAIDQARQVRPKPPGPV